MAEKDVRSESSMEIKVKLTPLEHAQLVLFLEQERKAGRTYTEEQSVGALLASLERQRKLLRDLREEVQGWKLRL